jgi:hypothetical protein
VVWTDGSSGRLGNFGNWIDCNTPENAELVCETGSVRIETGLTPRQLADQRAELLAALESVMDRLVDRHENDEAAIQARAAIAKARGAT